MHEIKNITITSEILKLIAEIDEFKGRWTVIETLAPERLTTLRRIATIESVGSSTRIEGARLSDAEVEKLLSGLRSEPFASRDEQVLYQFSTEILREHFVTDEIFAQALAEFGERGLVDIIGSLGNFSMLAMLLNTFQVDLQAVEPPFPDVRGYAKTAASLGG